ncbi:MAG TPA: LapA family protein [Burkholderiales bacterium]|nr:LapA family protein [Burkholderiales bacterium]
MLLIVAALLAVFVAVNWTAFTAPTRLSLVLGAIEAPLGIVMLIIFGFASVLFLGYALYQQSRFVVESRRLTRTLERERELAANAEQSRIAELRTLVQSKLDELLAAQRVDPSATGGAGDDLRRLIEDGFNGIAAQIAELDDRLTARDNTTPH